MKADNISGSINFKKKVKFCIFFFFCNIFFSTKGSRRINYLRLVVRCTAGYVRVWHDSSRRDI